ncbi:septation protein SepH [Luteococcus japonicus]|uniref:septation protein SepH n=1 Tax=Luteococcus japonicus TaxID=33984 RepID=UPI002119A56E|nr:septation protein SepH [Luteococcus japonicus]
MPTRFASTGEDMTSPLSPRDIQTRIRSGASLEEVAHVAGVPVEKVEPFAAPVLAEREHVAGTALQCPVRRRGETGSVRSMRSVVTDKLAPHGVVIDEEDWDAWRNEDRRWTVQGCFEVDGERRVARFIFDQRARFSVANNDEARWLIGEVTASQPVSSPDAEPTIDLNDELALIRAVQGSVPIVETPASPSEPVRSTPVQAPAALSVGPAVAAQPEETAEPEADDTEVEDYAPAEFEEVDGVYDFVPKNTSDMDVLYDMLSSFAEDSVNIYAGLTNPVTQDVPEPVDAVLDEAEVEPEASTSTAKVTQPEPTPEPQPEQTDEQEPQPESTPQPEPLEDPDDVTEPKGERKPHLAAVVDRPEESPVARPAQGVVVEVELPQSDVPQPDVPQPDLEVLSTGSADVAEAAVEVEQTPLVESPAPEPAPKPKPKPRSRKKRASVPSWDEIMFGGPTHKKD